MPKTTTPKSYVDRSLNNVISVSNYYGLNKEQRAILELQIMLEEERETIMKLLIAYAITFVPLAICLLCCMWSYLTAFTRNLRDHVGSPLFPLIISSYRTIRYHYIGLFAFGITGIGMSIGKQNFFGVYLLRVFAILAYVLTVYVAMYQIVISIISIHRFVNSRQSPELRGELTRKNVFFLVIFMILVVIFKDVGIVAWMVVLLVDNDFGMEEIYTVTTYYSMVYITHQILLFIATIFQFCISEAPKSHSEYCVVTHTKYIGLVKMILGAICFACYLLKYETVIASTLFFGVDIFLVPVVIQITEIRAKPNVIIPTEIRKVPMKV
ncbi:hypothetical protein B9Z55_018166 [Caenorhabditis nigoni]|uniref:Serpentine receptor class gamma n=1 Tax=Caenorhabditis nigoni TaxID=1611254 RepID=A0A2G5TCK6_9PELO|nr:hypothetical protein B9Z55_018166 [Caenorhabditis nigoni]